MKCVKCGKEGQLCLISFYPFGDHCEECFLEAWLVIKHNFNALDTMARRIHKEQQAKQQVDAAKGIVG